MLRLLRLDALALLRDRLALAALVIGSVASLLAVVVGHAWVERLSRSASAASLTASTERATARD